MANDRVFIKCKYCGGWKMLLKFFPSTGLKHRDNDILNWLDKHADCHPKRYNIDLDGDTGFTLHTENDLWSALTKDKQNYEPK